MSITSTDAPALAASPAALRPDASADDHDICWFLRTLHEMRGSRERERACEYGDGNGDALDQR
jgi:hypothetical protein